MCHTQTLLIAMVALICCQLSFCSAQTTGHLSCAFRFTQDGITKGYQIVDFSNGGGLPTTDPKNPKTIEGPLGQIISASSHPENRINSHCKQAAKTMGGKYEYSKTGGSTYYPEGNWENIPYTIGV
jgi:hypothetical protein